MSEVQVLLDGAGVSRDEILRSVRTLLGEVRTVHLVNVSAEDRHLLQTQFGDAVGPLPDLRPDKPLVVSSGSVAFASGSLGRLRRHSETPGRCLTRVLVPGLSGAGQLSCWSAAWLTSYGGDMNGLVDADQDFDREQLPKSSATARAWVLGEEIGVALVADVDPEVMTWRRRTGFRLATAHVWGARVRAPAGVARRRLSRWMQRRQRAGVRAGA